MRAATWDADAGRLAGALTVARHFQSFGAYKHICLYLCIGFSPAARASFSRRTPCRPDHNSNMTLAAGSMTLTSGELVKGLLNTLLLALQFREPTWLLGCPPAPLAAIRTRTALLMPIG